jgi:hypothetical protein
MLANNYLLIALHSKFRAMFYKIYIQLKTIHTLHIVVIHASEPNVSYSELINSVVIYLFHFKVEDGLFEQLWPMSVPFCST